MCSPPGIGSPQRGFGPSQSAVICSASITTSGSDELIAGAPAARRLVIGTIRAHLRGADACTAAELTELNAIRRSTALFAPYE